MTNQNNEVKNVHEEVDNSRQVILEAKAQALIKLMAEEPAARLIPNLRVSEYGIIPDVRLVLVDSPKNDGNTSEAVEGADKGDDSASSKSAPTTESTEPQTA